jgi:8-oxo-dGTP pyrophosphatase MutT (NUDIX family)
MRDESFGIVPIFSESSELQVLLVQHRAGHWGFPKGHAESTETAIAAACREFEEETGIHDYQLLNLPAFSESYSFVKKDQVISKTVTYFVASVQNPQVSYQIKEIRDYAWLNFPEAIKKISFPQSKAVLQQVSQVLQES